MSDGVRVFDWEQSVEERVEAELILMRRRLLRLWPLVALLLAVIGALSWAVGRLSAPWVGVVVAVGVLGFLGLWLARFRGALDKALRANPEAYGLGPVRWELDSAGARVEMANHALWVPWHAVSEVVEKGGFLFLFISRSRALLLPTRLSKGATRSAPQSPSGGPHRRRWPPFRSPSTRSGPSTGRPPGRTRSTSWRWRRRGAVGAWRWWSSEGA